MKGCVCVFVCSVCVCVLNVEGVVCNVHLFT